MISGDEIAAINDINRIGKRSAHIKEKCSIPAPSADAKVVIISVHEGKTVSTVSVAGQSDETNVIPFQIDKTDDKLYIIASSYSPVIWQFTGDVGKIENVILAAHPVSQLDKKISAGSVGVSAEKVAFRNVSDCGLVYNQQENEVKNPYLLTLVQELIGRVPDYYYGGYSVTGLQLFNGRLNAGNSKTLERV